MHATTVIIDNTTRDDDKKDNSENKNELGPEILLYLGEGGQPPPGEKTSSKNPNLKLGKPAGKNPTTTNYSQLNTDTHNTK